MLCQSLLTVITYIQILGSMQWHCVPGLCIFDRGRFWAKFSFRNAGVFGLDWL